MKVTEVTISLYDKPQTNTVIGKDDKDRVADSKIVAFADIVLDSVLLVRGLIITQTTYKDTGKSKLRFHMPNKKLNITDKETGQPIRKDIVHPIQKELFDDILKSVLDSYRLKVGQPVGATEFA